VDGNINAATAATPAKVMALLNIEFSLLTGGLEVSLLTARSA
jgi:hypothetical protein